MSLSIPIPFLLVRSQCHSQVIPEKHWHRFLGTLLDRCSFLEVQSGQVAWAWFIHPQNPQRTRESDIPLSNKNIGLPSYLGVQIHGLLAFLDTCPQDSLLIFFQPIIKKAKNCFFSLSILLSFPAQRPPCQSQSIKIAEYQICTPKHSYLEDISTNSKATPSFTKQTRIT